jgi:uncharacterized protein (TIGR02217 family)
MSFLNSPFPLELSAIDSNDTWDNTIIALGGGGESRNINWSDSKRIFDAKTAASLTIPNLNLIRKHFNSMRGSGFSFPLRDRSLFQAATEAFGVGDGVTTQFQLSINDGNSSNAYNREIFLAESGTISVFDNATPVVEGAGAGKFTVPYSGATAGLVTFGTAPVAGHVLTWSGNFYLPVRYNLKSFPNASLFIWTQSGVGLAQGPSIPMVEVRYPGEF